MKPLVSLVIPSYNSAEEMPQTLRTVQAYFAKQSYVHEVIVVNDGSQDHTAATLKALAEDYPELVALHNDLNMGKGYSIRRAILESSGRYVFYTDADLAYPIEELECFLTPLMAGLYDVSVGSRVHEASSFCLHPRHFRYVYRRHVMSRFFNWLVRASLGLHVMDTQCGFKGFTARAAKNIFSQVRLSGFAFDVEALLLAQRLDLRIIELPVTFRYSGEVSTVKIIQNACQALFDLSRVYQWDQRGLYQRNDQGFLPRA
jgi:dolichyl-phosphate beta-glucosyltransferase